MATTTYSDTHTGGTVVPRAATLFLSASSGEDLPRLDAEAVEQVVHAWGGLLDVRYASSQDDAPGAVSIGTACLVYEEDGALEILHTVGGVAQSGAAVFRLPRTLDAATLSLDLDGSGVVGAVRGDTAWPRIADYGGVSAAFVHAETGQVVWIHCVGAAGSERLVATGAAAVDGTRTVYGAIDFDWRRPFRVVARVSTQVDEVYASVDGEPATYPIIAATPSPLAPNGRIGSWAPTGAPEYVVAAVNGSWAAGDALRVLRVSAATEQRALVRSGAAARDDVRYTSLAVARDGYGGQGRGILSGSGDYAGPWAYTRDVDPGITSPDAAASWAGLVQLGGSVMSLVLGVQPTEHVGSYRAGVRVVLGGTAGTDSVVLEMLDDFQTRYIGLAKSAESRDLLDTYDLLAHDWRDSTCLTLYVDWIDGYAEVHVGASGVSRALSGVCFNAEGTDEQLPGAALLLGTYGSGQVAQRGAAYSGACVWATATHATAGWVADASDITALAQGDALILDGLSSPQALEVGAYWDAEVQATFGRTRAVAVRADFSVLTWLVGGVTEPVRVPIGPILWARTGDDSICGVYLIRRADGAWVLFLGSRIHPVEDVLSDTPRGIARSVRLDSVEPVHVVLEVVPGYGITVHRAGESVPDIYVPWANRASVFSETPTELVASPGWAGVGAPTGGVRVAVYGAAVSAGFSFSCTYALPRPTAPPAGYVDAEHSAILRYPD